MTDYDLDRFVTAQEGVHDTAVAELPRAFIYNPFNAWGKQREVPDAPEQTFRDWYLKNRSAK